MDVIWKKKIELTELKNTVTKLKKNKKLSLDQFNTRMKMNYKIG